MKEIQLLAVKLVQFFPNLIQIEMTSIAEKKPLYFKANDGSKTLLLPDLAFILIVPDGPGKSPEQRQRGQKTFGSSRNLDRFNVTNEFGVVTMFHRSVINPVTISV